MDRDRFTRRLGALLASVALLAGCGASPQAPAPTPAAAPTVVPTAAAATAVLAAPATSIPAVATAAPTSAPIPTAAPAATTATTAPAAAPAFSRTLRLADPRIEGDDVRAAQQRLSDLGFAQVGPADGVFGPNSEAAVRTFQAANGLEVDGILGPQTWARLFGADAVAPGVDPIVDADHGWLLGGVQAGQWVSASAAAAGLRGGETYRLFSSAGPAGNATGSKPEADPGPCSDLFTIQLTPSATVTGTIALAGDWNPLPRTPVEESTDAPAARQAVAELLKANGIAQPDVRLTRVLRADLEGDGVEETMIAATRYVNGGEFPSPDSAAGDYSLVVILKTVAGRVQTIPVAAEYYPTPKEFNAPNQHDLVALLDLNGDGRMELVLYHTYYEGAATFAYSVAGDQVQPAFGAGCGV